MTRLFKITLVILAVGLVSVPLLSCASNTDSTSGAQNQIATVQRGDLVIDIPATGNLALSHKEDLAFEIAGIVEEVLVEAGDSVKEGQVLAKLDDSPWEDTLKALEDAVTKAKDNLTTAQRNVTDKELALREAQLNLETAEDSLEQIAQVKGAKDAVDDAQYNLDIARAITATTGIATGTGSSYRWDEQMLNNELVRAKSYLAEVLSGSTLPEDVARQLESSQIQVEKKQRLLEDAQIAVEKAQQTIEDDQEVLADAQEALDDAKSKSPEVKAPFDGFITAVNVKGGQEIKKGTVAVTLADPTKFETEILVSEMDIFDVQIGGNATVQVNANSALNLSANVTRISPTATIQSGVVNYKVKVEIKSPEAVMQELQSVRQQVTGNTTQGQRSWPASGNLFGQAFGSSNLTQEQIAQMIQQRQQEQAGQAGTQTLTTQASQIAQLKEGLSVTVTIVVNQRSNVLLVSNRAISVSRGGTTVNVLKDGVTEQRSITAGLSDGVNTEVTGGLSEGEQVVITRTTTTTTSTSTQSQGIPEGRFFMP
ncbi:MAG: HlyD family efflux transporter periplasmic adaptor subunit [Chloroflexota bacterium]